MTRKSLFAVLLCFAVSSVPYAKTQTFGADADVKADYSHFTDSLIRRFDSDGRVHADAEANKQLLLPDLYFDIGAGWKGTSESVSGRSFNFAPGGGGSLNCFPFSPDVAPGGVARYLGGSDSVREGQIFGELNYKVNNWFIDVDSRRQGTQDLNSLGVDTQADAERFRAGGLIGFSF